MRKITRQNLRNWREARRRACRLEAGWRSDCRSFSVSLHDAAEAYGAISYGARISSKCPRWPDRWGSMPPWKKESPTAATYPRVLMKAASGYLAELMDVVEPIKRQVRRWGAFRVDQLPKSQVFPTELAIRLLAPNREIVHDRQRGLVVVRTPSSVLARRASKILVALESITMLDLCSAIRSDDRFVSLSCEDVSCILKHHSRFRVDRDRVILDRESKPLARLTTVEETALSVLRDSNGIVDREYYHHAMSTMKIGKPSADAALRSPFIVRVDPGIYALLGRDCHPKEIGAAKAEKARRFRSTLVRFELDQDTGIAFFYYRLSIPSIRSGRLPLPSSARVSSGAWTTHFPDGTEGTLQVGSGSLRGLRPWMRRANSSVGSDIVLKVCKNNRVIHVIEPGQNLSV